jgi:hypothetical protein
MKSNLFLGRLVLTLLLAWSGAISGSAKTAPFNPALVNYRLEAQGLNFKVLGAYQGEKIVVQMDLTNATAGETTASLRLNSERLEPFFPYIPPYIGLGARKFTAKLWIGSLTGVKNLHFIFDHTGVDFQIIRVDLRALKPNQWNKVELEDAKLGSIEHPLTGVRVEVSLAPGARGSVYLADAVLTTDTAKTYALLTTEMPLMLTGMTKPLAEGPAHALPMRDSLTMGGYDIQYPEWNADLKDMTAYMNARFPDADFVIAPVWTPSPVLSELLPHLPPGVFFQFQKAQLDTRYMEAMGGNPANASGKTYNHIDNALVATHPLVQKALKDQIDYAASLGVNNFKQVDFVWYFEGGRWGYDPASVADFRDDLLGRDEGLDLLPGPCGEKAGVIHFWDYYENYHGMRLKPADIGINDWADYKPVSEENAASGNAEAKKNLGVFMALYHYEYLRLTQRLGRWAQAHGGKHDYTINPEDIGGGEDYVYGTRLAAAGTPFFEYFGGPEVLRGAYYDLPLYTRAGAAAGKKQGVITEIGEGGHGENYVDPEIGYLYGYELAALGLHDYHNEWAEGPFHVMSDPKNAYQYDRFSAWMSQAYGFRQARREETARPVPTVLSVSLRSVAHYISAWMWNINQQDSMAIPLSDAQLDFEQTDLSNLPSVIDKASVIFYTPPQSVRQEGTRLQAWLDQGGKTLVTHSYIPVSLDDGQALLKPGVKNVEFLGEDHNYSAYMADPVATPDFALLPCFKGLTQSGDKTWILPPGSSAKLILGTPDKPLLSQIALPKNSSILYIHVRPQDLSADEQKQVMDKLVELLQLPQIAIDPSGDGVMAHRFYHGPTEVISLWNRGRLNQLGFLPGYGAHLLVGRGADAYDPKKRPYPYLAPGAQCSAKIPVAAAGTYRVYRFFTDSEETVTVGVDKLLPVTVEGAVVEQFYIAPDGPAIQQEIAALHQHHAEVVPFLPDLSAK